MSLSASAVLRINFSVKVSYDDACKSTNINSAVARASTALLKDAEEVLKFSIVINWPIIRSQKRATAQRTRWRLRQLETVQADRKVTRSERHIAPPFDIASWIKRYLALL